MRTLVDRADEALSWQASSLVRMAELEAMPVGPGLVARLLGVADGPLGLDGAARVTALWDRVTAWSQARSMVSVSEAVSKAHEISDGTPLRTDQVVAHEVATLTHVSYLSAMNRVSLIRCVADRLPLAWEALDRGEVTLAHVKALAGATEGCDTEITRLVDTRVIPAAVERGWTPAELSRAARRAVIALDPDGAADRARDAKLHNSDVTLRPGADDTATVTVDGDALTLARVIDTVNTTADAMRAGGDTRPVGVRRLDALARAVLGPPDTRPAPEVHVTVDLATLLGLRDHPADLDGYGPVTRNTLRDLLTDATLRRVITDPFTGTVLHVTPTRYRPTAALRRYLTTRDATCRFPGCTRTARRADLDHTTPYPAGPTTPDNLHALCRTHHRLKTHKIWHVDVHPDHTETWTSPLGHHHTRPPHQDPTGLLDPPPVDHNEPPTPIWDNTPPPDPHPTEPPLTHTEYEQFAAAWEHHHYAHLADQHYNNWHTHGLIA